MNDIIDEITSKLKTYIEEYDKIIIWNCSCSQDDKVLEHFLEYVKEKGIHFRTLIILDEKPGIKEMDTDCRFVILYLSKHELDTIAKLYSMYEYSDKITYLTNTCQYPSLLHYLSTGVLTEEELFEALMR